MLTAIAALAVAAAHAWPSTSLPTAPSSIEAPRTEHRMLALPPRYPPGGSTGTTVFGDGVPGIANLDPALLEALRQAATDAAEDGVELVVNSGWRSRAYQEHLLREAIAKYGSREEAARWVATPTRSAHVSGDAVDIGPSDAVEWLSRNGVRYGLCQIYGNEPWHYELRSEASSRGCPAVYADPTHDPRMQPG